MLYGECRRQDLRSSRVPRKTSHHGLKHFLYRDIHALVPGRTCSSVAKAAYEHPENGFFAIPPGAIADWICRPENTHYRRAQSTGQMEWTRIPTN